MLIRPEKKDDISSIYSLHCETFPTVAEAKLVDRLRDEAKPVISLVAERADDIIGHLFFSPVTMDHQPKLKLMGLAPLAVLDEYQGNGIGSALVASGLKRCREQGVEAVFVLGHASYYPRFGFRPSGDFGIRCKYPVPPEVFMACELVPGALEQAEGIADYHPAFDQLDES